jgi:hypothetical protein
MPADGKACIKVKNPRAPAATRLSKVRSNEVKLVVAIQLMSAITKLNILNVKSNELRTAEGTSKTMQEKSSVAQSFRIGAGFLDHQQDFLRCGWRFATNFIEEFRLMQKGPSLGGPLTSFTVRRVTQGSVLNQSSTSFLAWSLAMPYRFWIIPSSWSR